MPRGRPRALTPESKAKMIGWVRDSLMSQKDCAKRLGIDHSVITRECDRDPEFDTGLKEASASMRDKLVGAIVTHGIAKDYRAAWAMLQAKWPEEFSRKPGQYTLEEFQSFALKMSDLVRKYVPETAQLEFAREVETIITEMDRQKKKNAQE